MIFMDIYDIHDIHDIHEYHDVHEYHDIHEYHEHPYIMDAMIFMNIYEYP